MNRIVTIPNIISSSRLALTWPIAYGIYYDNLQLTFLTGFLAVISDFFDGYLSRKLNQKSEIGKVIDPIVDCILVLTILTTLLIKRLIPLWYIATIVARYMCTFLLLLKYKLRSNKTPESVNSGKWSMFGIAFVIIASLLQAHFPYIFWLSLIVSTNLLLMSALDYIHTYWYT